MKKTVYLLFALLLTATAFSQTTKSVDDLVKDLQIELNKAVVQENYGKAENLKNKIKVLESNKEEIKGLQKEKNEAILAEDYKKAEQLKNKIEALITIDPVEQIIVSPLNVEGSDVDSNNVQILFKIENNKKVMAFDVKIDDTYVGTFGKGKDLLVKNISKGKKRIELFMIGAPNDGAQSFLTEEEFTESGTYVLNMTFLDGKNPQQFLKLMKQNKKDFKNGEKKPVQLFTISKVKKSERNDTDVYLTSNYNEPIKNIYPKKSSVYNTSQFKTDLVYNFTAVPDNQDGFPLSFNGSATYLIGTSNVFLGFVENFYVLAFNGWEDAIYTFGISPSFGYQIEPSDKIILQGYVTAGPYFSWLDVSPESSFDLTFSGYAAVNAQYYFNNSVGITNEISVGFRGEGLGFSLGVTFRGIQNYKYRHLIY